MTNRHFVEDLDGARHISVVEHLLMVQWVVRSIPHGGHIELFHVPASWCNNYLVHIKDPLLLIGKSSPCSGDRSLCPDSLCSDH